MPGGRLLLTKAGPWVVKQLPKLWPLLLESRNRDKLMQIAQDLANRSPSRQLRAKVELTAVLADRVAETAVTNEERELGQEWSRRARNLTLRLDMPVVDRQARKAHLQSVRAQLEQLQREMDRHLDGPPRRPIGPGGSTAGG